MSPVRRSKAARPRARTGGRGYRAPALVGLTIAGVLGSGVTVVAGARADLAADRGIGPVVRVAAAAQQASPPVRLGIPTLGLTTRLIGVRKASSGALGVPADPLRAGWYSQGVAPGDGGPAVIVGHVDSVQGPGVFAGLRDVPVGAQIHIRRADGSLVTFVVKQVSEYPKRSFPTEAVYRGGGRPSLRLITCGGEFDRSSGHYRSNVIVYAEAA